MGTTVLPGTSLLFLQFAVCFSPPLDSHFLGLGLGFVRCIALYSTTMARDRWLLLAYGLWLARCASLASVDIYMAWR